MQFSLNQLRKYTPHPPRSLLARLHYSAFCHGAGWFLGRSAASIGVAAQHVNGVRKKKCWEKGRMGRTQKQKRMRQLPSAVGCPCGARVIGLSRIATASFCFRTSALCADLHAILTGM